MPRRKVKMRKRKIWVEEADDKYLSLVGQGRVSEEYRRCVKRRIYADAVRDEVDRLLDSIAARTESLRRNLAMLVNEASQLSDDIRRLGEIIKHMYSL